jgi:hypothetical protein
MTTTKEDANLIFGFRRGMYPFNFSIWTTGFYIFLRLGDHNFRLFSFPHHGLRLTHEVMPLPDKVTNGYNQEYN